MTSPVRRIGFPGGRRDAWIAFARTGDPNHKGLPTGPAVSGTATPRMLFGATCKVSQVSSVGQWARRGVSSRRGGAAWFAAPTYDGVA